ncbi:MAG: histidine--tRNA ligase [Deltaproteobacteria bacterium]|nr:histidine--tRNA ligase [Deltaproteobacteria bacterium]
MSKYSSIRGINDVLPAETGKWQYIEAAAKKVFHNYGYSEIKVPILEKTNLFTRSIGEDTDIVEKEMYTFPDRKGELLSLRPEGTASVVRSYVQHKMYSTSSLTRLYYFGPMFRYERPQKGRSRQFYQLGAEAIGISGPAIDAEIISMLFTFFKALGIDGLKLNLNSIGCRDCRPGYKEKLLDFIGDSVEKLCENCRRRYRENPLRVLDCKSSACREETKAAPSILDHLCGSCSNDFSKLKEYLGVLNLSYNINPRMVRGLDYYTKTAFEITSANLGSQDAVAAGGRYDHLVEEVGGPTTPAIGYAIGMERLSLLLDDDLKPGNEPDLFIATLGNEAFDTAFRVTHELRTHGIHVEYDHEGKSLKAQMRKAGNCGAAYVLVLGDEEIRSGRAMLKNMKDHEQREIIWEDIVSEMNRIRH